MDQEKKQEDRGSSYFIYAIIFVVVLIVFLLCFRYFPTGMFSKQDETQSYSYNGFVFTNITGLWFTELQKAGTNKVYSVPLHFGPLELKDVPIEGDVNVFKNLTELYLTFDPTGEEFSYIALAASEISINLAQTLDITPVAACTVNDSRVCEGRPIIDCKSNGSPAIMLRYDNSTRVFVENNCIFVQGAQKDLIKAADRLLLKWFSVMS